MNLLDRMAYLMENPDEGPTLEQISEARAIIRGYGSLTEVQSDDDAWLDELDNIEIEHES